MRQRGFIGTAQIVVLAIAATLVASLSVGLWIQTNRLESCEVKRASLQDANEAFVVTVEEQNSAIDALLDRASTRQQEGDKKLAVAKRGRARAQAEARRLQQARSRAGTCGEAVQEVKKGLQP